MSLDLDKVQSRFWGHVALGKMGCWVWFGGVTKRGYGQTTMDYKNWRAHRLSYTWLRGKIPKDKILDHICENKLCVNPGHLYACTHKENVLRGVGLSAQNARKTHCKRGHPLSGKNLRTRMGYRGRPKRECRACCSMMQKKWGKK